RRGPRRCPLVGVLTLRAKPPTEEEFIECLQKIKFSFNLLARLKDHLHDPTAEEHVQSLFQTLTRVVQESGGPELAETVVSPLLTRDALLLLAPSTSGDGIHLWSSLGEAWSTPRSAWNKPAPVPHYVPVFRSGWQPHVQKKVSFVDAEPSQPSPSAWPPGQTRGEVNFHESRLKRKYQIIHLSTNHHSPYARMKRKGFPGNLDIWYRHKNMTISEIRMAVMQQEIKIARRSYAEIDCSCRGMARCLYDYVARSSSEISVLAGDILQVLDSTRSWWKVASNGAQQMGYVPHNILE
uniref:SH3 domain-containing protein n=1 Tax=Petromyzon marinus TaxID=7757 RepID=S4R932_PETMA